MPDFSKDLFDFYRFLSPADSFGKFTIDSSVGPGKEKNKKPLSQVASDNIKEKVIDEFTSGFDLVNLKGGIGQFNDPQNLTPAQEEYVQIVKGSYNVVYQQNGLDRASYLYSGYFAKYPSPIPPQQPVRAPAKPAKPAKPVVPAPPPAPPVPTLPAAPELPSTNYWANICGETGGPPIDLSMIFLRAPMLSKIANNTDIIQLYLTAMPPIFANQLMPYCDVEFQLPVLDNSEAEDKINRPSLYRFLMGSGQDLSKLTEADKSIANVLDASTSEKRQARKAGEGTAKNQTFFGMEMFTSPQTLVNMDALRENNTAGSARLNNAKPFLPPATLKDVAITVQNAGAGSIGRRTGSIKLQVHDRKRLVEMGEFLRGSDGYAKSTVWITYGMLAPRGRGEYDAYAKFVNENMLVREAFVICNSQFSFTPDGGCEVSLTLSAKGGSRGLTTPITFGDIEKKRKEIDVLIANIKKDIALFGGPREEKAGFDKKEIRIAQVISSAAEGNIPSSPEDIKSINEDIEVVKKTLGGAMNRGTNFNKDSALALLTKLQGAMTQRASTKLTAETFVKNKLTSLSETNDPFLPDLRKNDFQSHRTIATGAIGKAVTAAVASADGIVYYDPLLCKTVPDKSVCVSFGRLFSALCVPALTNAIADEFEWNETKLNDNDNKCPYEIQFIFYQLNNKCGPVSSHNIAEFPMNKEMFVDAFSQLIEATGGDAITLEGMLNLINDQLGDPRQPGYGRSTFYKPFSVPKKDATKPVEDQGPYAPATTPEQLTNQLNTWAYNYGDFVTPSLTFELEVSSKSGGPVDLLSELSGKVAAGYNTPVLGTSKISKTILKYHIYDRTSSPMDKTTKSLRLAKDGTYYFVSSEHGDDIEFLSKLNDTPTALTDTGQAVSIGKGQEALMEYLGQIVPRIVIGTEGSLITQINLQSKTSGLEGTIALQGGTQKRDSSLASTGLSQRQFNMPMILYPAQLTMTTLGCPLVAMAQHFFIDFGTNTTLDNEYVVTQVSHTFGKGKFESSWTLCYYDGYGRMISGNDIKSQIEVLKKAIEERKAGPPAPLPPTPAPRPASPPAKAGAPAKAKKAPAPKKNKP